MTRPRSLLSVLLIGSAFVTLVNLSLPITGYAQSPHTCPNGHQSQNLGGVSSYAFVFKKNCSPYTSGAVIWKFDIHRYSDNVKLCGSGEYTIPPTPRSFSCSGLPIGTYPKVKVVIWYKTSATGSWMTHTELYGNY